MPPRRFHLAWFLNFTPDEWDHPAATGGSPWTGDFYVEMAKALERACFDYLILEDTLMVSEAYGGNTEAYLKHALMVPKHDPAPLAALIGAATSRLGVVATLSTMAYPPFMLARLCSTLDHIAQGRFGWNIVTSDEHPKPIPMQKMLAGQKRDFRASHSSSRHAFSAFPTIVQGSSLHVAIFMQTSSAIPRFDLLLFLYTEIVADALDDGLIASGRPRVLSPLAGRPCQIPQ